MAVVVPAKPNTIEAAGQCTIISEAFWDIRLSLRDSVRNIPKLLGFLVVQKVNSKLSAGSE